MADPIDRNELLNVYKGYRDFDKVHIGSLRAEIKAQPGIPSAQPEIIDGRLFVTVDDIEKVGCVLVDEHKSNFCRQFWMDGDGPAPCEDTVSRAWLLAEYDRQHQGPPGGARKIIETAPPVTPKQAEVECCADCKYDGYGRIGECARCCYSYASHFAHK